VNVAAECPYCGALHLLSFAPFARRIASAAEGPAGRLTRNYRCLERTLYESGTAGDAVSVSASRVMPSPAACGSSFRLSLRVLAVRPSRAKRA
jgi:hypothetical protein